MDYDFVLHGRRAYAARDQVIAALRGVQPGRFHKYRVEIEGVVYPITQAFAVAFGVKPGTISTWVAERVFQRLGFAVTGPDVQRLSRIRPRTPARAPAEPGERQELTIGPIRLEWCAWQRWEDLEVDSLRDGQLIVPENEPGVYEVAREGDALRLVIGRAANLCDRIIRRLVRGKHAHMAGRRVEAYEDLSKVRIRWALTDRPAAVEEELHQRHLCEFGVLPRYTSRT